MDPAFVERVRLAQAQIKAEDNARREEQHLIDIAKSDADCAKIIRGTWLIFVVSLVGTWFYNPLAFVAGLSAIVILADASVKCGIEF